MVNVTFKMIGKSDTYDAFRKATRVLEEEGWATINIKNIIELDETEEAYPIYLITAKVWIV